MSEQIERIVDLDLLLGEPINVKLGGQSYRLPADCPAELYLQMLRVAQEAGEVDETDTENAARRELELFAPLRDGLLELFQVHQPDMQRLPMAIGLEMLVSAIGRIYGQGTAGPTEPEPSDSPPSQGRGTKKPTAKRKRSTSAPATA